MRVVLPAACIVVVGAVAAWGLTAPKTLSEADLSGLTPDPVAGALTFAAAGCASCHVAPDDKGEDLVLSGGTAFTSPFGTFYAPNISPSDQGIGQWSDAEIANAVVHGVNADGQHLYPAFPYTSYERADLQDVVNLVAYLRTLPASDQTSRPHDVGFPFNIRRSLGGWKLLFDHPDPVVTGDLTPEQLRGREIVEGLGHCGECHTARNALGGLEYDRWLVGAANPTGDGRIPNITPAALNWSKADIAEYLRSGFTPDYDTAGGEMAEVIRNTAQLTDDDRNAIAAYLKIVPPVASE